MKKTSTSRSAAITFCAGFMVLLGMGCAGNAQGTRAALSASGAEAVEGNIAIATVTNIDREHQVVTVKEADGEQSDVAVSDNVIVGRMEIGDKVRVDYQKSLGFQLLEPGQSLDEVEFTDKALPAGVLFGRRIATTVEFVKIADKGAKATFRSQDGRVHKLKLDTKAKQETLARLRPGDEVAASCTEKLSINLHR